MKTQSHRRSLGLILMTLAVVTMANPPEDSNQSPANHRAKKERSFLTDIFHLFSGESGENKPTNEVKPGQITTPAAKSEVSPTPNTVPPPSDFEPVKEVPPPQVEVTPVKPTPSEPTPASKPEVVTSPSPEVPKNPTPVPTPPVTPTPKPTPPVTPAPRHTPPPPSVPSRTNALIIPKPPGLTEEAKSVWDHAARFIGDQVSKSRLRKRLEKITGADTIDGTTKIENRFSEQNKLLAVRFFKEIGEQKGWKVEVKESPSGVSRFLGDEMKMIRNISFTKKGTRFPDQVVEFLTHYDSNNPMTPGADDNGSGTVAGLELLDLFEGTEALRTRRITLTDLEELGFIGSEKWGDFVLSRERQAQGEKVVAAFFADMLGTHPPEAPGKPFILDCEIGNNPRNQAVGNALYYQLGKYKDRALKVAPLINDTSPDMQDYGRYWERGIPAVNFSENIEFATALYHTPQDTVENINFDYLARNAGFIAELMAAVSGTTLPASLMNTFKTALPKYVRQLTNNWEPDRNHIQRVYQEPTWDERDERMEDATFHVSEWFEGSVKTHFGNQSHEDAQNGRGLQEDLLRLREQHQKVLTTSGSQKSAETRKLKTLMHALASKWDAPQPRRGELTPEFLCTKLVTELAQTAMRIKH